MCTLDPEESRSEMLALDRRSILFATGFRNATWKLHPAWACQPAKMAFVFFYALNRAPPHLPVHESITTYPSRRSKSKYAYVYTHTYIYMYIYVRIYTYTYLPLCYVLCNVWVHVMPCVVMRCCVAALWYHAVLCYGVLCYAMLWCVTLCCFMLCYVM